MQTRHGHGYPMDRTRWREIVSGRAPGVWPRLVRLGLWTASGAYALGTIAWDWSYRSGFRSGQKAGIPVVSIGNLTAGGTGKTPLCAWIARWFRQRRVRVCLISRGYGSIDGTPNDEALVLEQLCPDVPHLQGPDRAQLAHVAREELDSQLIILDDGFQHRRLNRDLDVVLIDATNPFGWGHFLPRGLLRERRSALARADAILITRAETLAPPERDKLDTQIQRFNRKAPLLHVSFVPESLICASARTEPLESLRGKRVVAFCGLGNPDAFRRTVEDCGAIVTSFHEFPDHHPYARPDIDRLRQSAAETGAGMAVTSQKDLVKIGTDQLGSTPLRAIRIDVQFLDSPGPLEALLERIASTITPSEPLA